MSARAAAAEVTRERIIAASVAAFSAHWYEDVTVRGIAGDADVALQTVRNHFPSKEALFSVAIDRISGGIESVRGSVTPGDMDGAISTLVDDYEATGDILMRLLAVEERVAVVEPVIARGRAEHQAWVERVFAAALAGLRGKTRSRRIAQLVVATDVYAWKLLRRDKGLDRNQTITAMRELVASLHDKPEGGSR